jgi:predicted negative regulator of RcsB-dependent stress response
MGNAHRRDAMDSEHRHELEENALATWLGSALERWGSVLPAVVAGALLAVAGFVGWSYYSTGAASASAERWQKFYLAVEGSTPNLDALREASSEYAGSPVGDWADITWADGRLFNAADQFLRNRSGADAAIAEAIAKYETLRDSKDAEIADRAVFGLARAYDMRGELDKAIQQYELVRGAFANLAVSRAEELKKPRTKADYAWLAAAATSPAAPASGARPDLEPDDASAPADTEASLDDTMSKLGPIADEKAPGSPATADAAIDNATEAEADAAPAEEPAK